MNILSYSFSAFQLLSSYIFACQKGEILISACTLGGYSKIPREKYWFKELKSMMSKYEDPNQIVEAVK